MSGSEMFDHLWITVTLYNGEIKIKHNHIFAIDLHGTTQNSMKTEIQGKADGDRGIPCGLNL